MYDSSPPSSKVAVLLPRAVSAEGLAHYVSQLRGCAVGQQVGLGVAGKADMSEASRIVFMTYGFFNTISAADANLSSWSAVIMDEAHERKADADAVFVRLTAVCKARPEFKVVVMSAFIAPQLLADSVQKQGVSTSVLDVPGVVFPIKDEWFSEESWDPSSTGAIKSLALECIRVYLQVIINTSCAKDPCLQHISNCEHVMTSVCMCVVMIYCTQKAPIVFALSESKKWHSIHGRLLVSPLLQILNTLCMLVPW